LKAQDSPELLVIEQKKGKTMIGRNFNVKSSKNFLIIVQKMSPENSLLLARNRQNTEMISLSYDVNDHSMFTQNKIHI